MVRQLDSVCVGSGMGGDLTWDPTEQGSQPTKPVRHYVPDSYEAIDQGLTLRRASSGYVMSCGCKEDAEVDQGRYINE